MPPESSEELSKPMREHLDSLTPERAEGVASAIAEQWSKDWGLILEKVIEKTGLSRSDAFQFMVLREIATARSVMERSAKPIYHENCKACQQEKEFHEAQFDSMKLSIKHMREEHGPEDWEK